MYGIDPATGALTVVYEFSGAPDGASPMAGLIAVKDVLFGTTSEGGQGGNSYGTVFKYNPRTSKETILASFAGGANGAKPFAGLLYDKGYLYGTAQYGGTGNCGTVFKLKLS